MSLSPVLARLTALGIGTALAAGVAWLVYPRGGDEPVIELVDRSAELEELRQSGQLTGLTDAGTENVVRRLLPKGLARKVFAIRPPMTVYDPLPYFRRGAFLNIERKWAEHPDGVWYMVTNSHGMREQAEILREPPDLRVLVVGDSHTDGVCNNDESFPNLLEAQLAADRPGRVVEVLNHGTGGYSFHNYLGVFEKFHELRPDLFLVAVYGGNDFYDVLAPYHVFTGTPIPRRGQEMEQQVKRAASIELPALAQGMLALRYFKKHPEEIPVALEVCLGIMEELRIRCEKKGIELLCVYIPSMYDAQWDQMPKRLERVREALALSDEDLRVTDEMATRFLDALRERGVALVDGRDRFRAAREPLYWRSDHHIDLAGHRVVAELLRQPVLGIWAAREAAGEGR